MIMKWLVLGLIVAGIWYGFKMIARRNKAKQMNDARAARDGVENMTACAVCGTYVTAQQGNCGRDACPYPG